MEEVADQRPNCGSGLVLLVEGNAREKVVDDMGLDNVVEQMAAHPAKIAVNGGQRALYVGPALGVVMVDVGVVVVQEGNCN